MAFATVSGGLLYVLRPYTIVASPKVHGLKTASELPFGNYEPKPWWGEVWVAS